MMRHLLAGGVLIAFSLSLHAEPLGTLTAKDIEDAISWTARADPAPYALHHQSPDPRRVNPVIVGAVYTPFVRVALAAKAASDAGRVLSADDVPPQLLEPLAYVAMRWYCCDDDHGSDAAHFDPSTPFDYKIAVPGYDRFTESFLRQNHLRLAVPLWVNPATAVISDLGGTLPFADTVLVAAYPIAALVPDLDVVIYRDELKPGVSDGYPRRMILGRITPDDVVAWR
jgi:hypothetical protein